MKRQRGKREHAPNPLEMIYMANQQSERKKIMIIEDILTTNGKEGHSGLKNKRKVGH